MQHLTAQGGHRQHAVTTGTQQPSGLTLAVGMHSCEVPHRSIATILHPGCAIQVLWLTDASLRELLLRHTQEFRRNAFNTDSVDEALDILNFCYKILEKSGLAEVGTYLPKAIHPRVRLCSHPAQDVRLKRDAGTPTACCPTPLWHAQQCRAASVLPAAAVQLCEPQDQHRPCHGGGQDGHCGCR